MSKQSRAKSRARKNHKKKVGTGTAATAIVNMPENKRYRLKHDILDSLHRELVKKIPTWGADMLNLFYCELWTDLEAAVSNQRKSQCKDRVIDMIHHIRDFYRM
jgi:hypothetical protein